MVLACATLAAAPAPALDGATFELGTGDDDIDRFGATLTWDWGVQWFADGAWYLGGHWEIGGSYWEGDEGRTGNESLGEFGVTPVLRLSPHKPLGGWSSYLELGVGVHLMTDDQLGDKDFGTEFAFGSLAGGGVRFGSRGQFELGYRYQHLSNAGIEDSNPGINYHMVRIGYRFD
jgi:hypothetical protein